MRLIIDLLAMILATLIIMVTCHSCIDRNADNYADDSIDMQTDSAKLVDMHNDMLDMVEDIYSNQGRYFNDENVRLFRSDSSVVKFSSFTECGTVYMYFTPLACWECIREISKGALESDNACSLSFIIPISLRNAVGRIMMECNIPSEQVYYIEGSLGLPIEEENKVFFFTITPGEKSTHRLNVENVFVPVRDADVVVTYLGALAEHFASISAI
ncbi:MAG: hypothetical protein K2J94_03575 [Duncaniella sp.]|nr:hypothetical protein [Duncaniella sp.]